MSITVAAAANAYAATAKIATAAKPPATPAESDFAGLLNQALSAVSEAGQQTDKVALQAAAGTGDLVDVVTAVAESELALETLVSVRDRVVSAYEEIMRMPI